MRRIAGNSWTRPVELTVADVREQIGDAVNDYAGERDRLRAEVIEGDFPKMAAARAKMQQPLLPSGQSNVTRDGGEFARFC